jgi:hypothetical protein
MKNINVKKYFELDEDLYLIGYIDKDIDEDGNYYLSKNDFDRIYSVFQRHKIKTVDPKLEQ